MGRYDLDEYEEYEEEGENQEEDCREDEEEDHEPTQEELEYLHLRQKLKESIRKKMKKDLSSGLANSQEKRNKMPYDSFGSFFGPSQPVIAQRVIQESKSLLENPHLAARVLKAKYGQKKGGASAGGSKPRSSEQPREVINLAKSKAKIQMLKDTRDYSFLSSEDAELPAPRKNPPKSVPLPKHEVHPSQKTPSNTGGKVINGRDERKPLPKVSQMQAEAGFPSQKPSNAAKLNSTSLESRKHLGRNDGSGRGQPAGSKALPLKAPPNKNKVISASVGKGSMPRPAPPVHEKPIVQRRDDRESSKGNIIAKKPVFSSKPQIKQLPAKRPPSVQQKEHIKKRPAHSYSDEEEDGDRAISMIRSMFRYNPSRYRGVNDDDDSDMEAGFDDIMKEEKRSARIAAKEDEEELRKIEEEERREQMRKEAKKRKLGHR